MKIDWYPNGQQVVRDILAGRSVELQRAFLWETTQEGEVYWSGVYRSLRDGKPLSDEARAKLVAMLLMGDG